MVGMSRSEASCPPSPSRPLGLSPVVLGTACCIGAAVGYTASNICLRILTVRQDPAWILCVKESVAVVLVGPWLLVQAARRQRVLPGKRTLAGLMAIGLATHLGGSLPWIWALGVVGLAITVPASLGVNLVVAAAFGWLMLRERVSVQSGLAIAVVIVSVLLLSAGAGQVNDSILTTAPVATGPFWIGLAILVSCLAGIIWAALTVAIRRSVTRGASIWLVAFIVPAMGASSLALVSLWRHGFSGLLATPADDFALMLICGLFNLVAYLAIIKGLQMTSVVHVNVLTASEAAMAAVAGLLFFQEASSPSLVAGVCLTVAGMALMDRPGVA
jgi:DME family drug/metabolite transporter